MVTLDDFALDPGVGDDPENFAADRSLLCYQAKLASKLSNAAAAARIGASVGAMLDPKQAKPAPHTLKFGGSGLERGLGDEGT